MSRRQIDQNTTTLNLQAPIDRWDEAIPLGNGLIGGLLWGASNCLKLSLDRGDLWDLRQAKAVQRPDWTYATLKRAVAAKDQKTITDLFEKMYPLPYPTKLPTGRVEFIFGKKETVRCFQLDLARAEGRAVFAASEMRAFFSALSPVAMLKITGAPPRIKVKSAFDPALVDKDSSWSPRSFIPGLGYPPPKYGRGACCHWVRQKGGKGFEYVIVVGTRRRSPKITEMAISVTAAHDGADPLQIGLTRVKTALAGGYDRELQGHARWWRKFNNRSRVSLPDSSVQQYYQLVQYFYGAASRRGAPPIPLQGVWTADHGRLPPWKGDYHHDLNTQLTYWAYLTANHLEEGLAFIDFLWQLMPAFRRFAREFYNTPGAAVPGVMALDGAPMGGWAMYSFSPTNGAWVAQTFHLHWRHTLDKEFLKQRAYPFCAEISACLAALLKKGANGKLVLPLSSSPEVHDGTLAAWVTPNSNYDLALMRWLFGADAEMAQALGRPAEEKHWRKMLAALPELAVHPPPNEVLQVSPDEILKQSHRHFSHLMALHPLGLITPEGPERDQRIIYHSWRQLDRLGHGFWSGFSFAWAACMAARCGLAERALNLLDIFRKAYTARNGFHLNGDFKHLGFSDCGKPPLDRAFTLEANFASVQAIHEMLLQSWGGVVRVFPAMPAEWSSAAFKNLRAEGAFLVTARRRRGKTCSIRIRAEQDGKLRLRNPFGAAAVRWRGRRPRRIGQDYCLRMKAGETLSAEVL